MVDDWLAPPDYNEQAAEKNSQQEPFAQRLASVRAERIARNEARAARRAEHDAMRAAQGPFEVVAAETYAALAAPPEVSEQAIVTTQKRTAAEEQYAKAWATLDDRQRIFLSALQQTGFSVSRAVKILNATPERPGVRVKNAITRVTADRWSRNNADFKFVLDTLKTETAIRVTTRDDLLLRAHRVAEYAEREAPILHQGADTGYRERNLGDMLRANEQLMRATKVIGPDVPLQGGTGPALIIQVVQRDGGLIDVTPKGVTIDLPAPHGT